MEEVLTGFFFVCSLFLHVACVALLHDDDVFVLQTFTENLS